MAGASSASRRILLTYDFPILSASEISVTEVQTPSSSIRCHRHARASALTSVLSGCGFEVGAISLPSGATMHLRPHRRWNARECARSRAAVATAECPFQQRRRQADC
jgi:hypothetical protein